MTPHEAADKKVTLAGEYSRLSERLESILEQKPRAWLEMRKLSKSAKDADRSWEASQLGIEEMKVKMAMDRIEKETSGINSYLRVAELQAKNLI